MKLFRILAVILVMSLVLGAALPALAQGPANTDSDDETKQVQPFQKGKPGVKPEAVRPQLLKPELAKFKTIKGVVKEVAADKIKVEEFELFFAPDTAVKVPTLSKSAVRADIKVGMTVIVMVYEKDGKLYIRHINVIPGKPMISHHVGTVVEYTEPTAGTDGKIIIQPKKGDKVTFDILAGKFKILPEGAKVDVGSLVTVISNREPSTVNRLIATGVVVHNTKPQPKPEAVKVSGLITAIDETAKTIKIGEIVVTYTEKTSFVLQGQLAVKVGQEAVASCLKKEDGTLVAQKVAIGAAAAEQPVASKIGFTTAAQTIAANAASAVITVQVQDASGNPVNVAAATTVNLTSSSATGKFDTSAAGPFNGTVVSVTIAAGANSASFFYKDATAGTPTITAASTGLTSGTQQITVN